MFVTVEHGGRGESSISKNDRRRRICQQPHRQNRRVGENFAARGKEIFEIS